MHKATAPSTRVLIVTHDPLGVKMAGPAIRALEIARALHPVTQVKLVSVTGSTLVGEEFSVGFVDEDGLREEVNRHDVLIFQGFTLQSYPWIAQTDIILVADLYDPMQLEVLVQSAGLPADEREHRTRITTEALTLQLERADYILCASEKQRDLWLGHLGALCRINPLTYDADPSLRSLIEVVPFGLQDSEPVQKRSALRGAVPGIEPDDKVIIWGGGIYNWFDPLTLIRAVSELAPRHPDLRLFFLGLQHPNPLVQEMRMAAEAQALAEELQLINSYVFFNQDWVPYHSRADYLLDADLGVSTHFEHIETAFSFRTRVLDYLWAGLPIVTTDGDGFADIIRQHRLGLVVPPEDIAALSAAIESALYSEQAAEFRTNVSDVRPNMRWSATLQPLVDFCKAPRHAADYQQPIRSTRELERQQLRELNDALGLRLHAAEAALREFSAANTQEHSRSETQKARRFSPRRAD